MSVFVAAALAARAEPLLRDPAVDRANKELVLSIVREIEGIPTVNEMDRIELDKLPGFSAKLLKRYQPDGKSDSPFRETVERAAGLLMKHAQSCPREFRANDAVRLITQVQAIQKTLASAKLELDEALEELLASDERRNSEPSPHWRAKHDYVLARLQEQQAYILEYQFMLAELRLGTLPQINPEQHGGWRLTVQETAQCKGSEGRAARRFADQACQRLHTIVERDAGTPWAMYARNESHLGLKWELLPVK